MYKLSDELKKELAISVQSEQEIYQEWLINGRYLFNEVVVGLQKVVLETIENGEMKKSCKEIILQRIEDNLPGQYQAMHRIGRLKRYEYIPDFMFPNAYKINANEFFKDPNKDMLAIKENYIIKACEDFQYAIYVMITKVMRRFVESHLEIFKVE